VQERNENKGEFSRKKLTGKRALELGAGLGLAGMGQWLCKSLSFFNSIFIYLYSANTTTDLVSRLAGTIYRYIIDIGIGLWTRVFLII
jgi:hypothetical protein